MSHLAHQQLGKIVGKHGLIAANNCFKGVTIIALVRLNSLRCNTWPFRISDDNNSNCDPRCKRRRTTTKETVWNKILCALYALAKTLNRGNRERKSKTVGHSFFFIFLVLLVLCFRVEERKTCDESGRSVNQSGET